MQLGRPGLEDHGHGSPGGQTIISAVVGSKRTELCDGVQGWRDAHAAGTAAIVILATVEQIDVVVLTHAVKLHAGISTDRHVGCGGIDLTRPSRRQSSKLVNAAAVHRKLRQLLAGDEVAGLARIRLHMDDVGFDGHRLLCCAQRHLEIHAPSVANV